jgi:tRNA-Thr(GGU) m(6)t(6)A37 methyltransferase TsaA
MKGIEIRPLGIVRNSRKDPVDDNWSDVESVIELEETIPAECLDGIEEFSHLEIIFLFHKSQKELLGSEHPRENRSLPAVGIFSQRKKDRPNHLGTTIVELIRREDSRIYVKKLDAIDETPVIDIKPVFRQFLPHPSEIRQAVWVEEIMKNYWT